MFCIGISVFFMLSFPLVGNPSGVVRSTQQYRKATRKIPAGMTSSISRHASFWNCRAVHFDRYLMLLICKDLSKDLQFIIFVIARLDRAIQRKSWIMTTVRTELGMNNLWLDPESEQTEGK